MHQTESIVKLAAALALAHAEIQPIGKDRNNDFFGSKYATLDTIMAELRPVLAKHKLSIVQGVRCGVEALPEFVMVWTRLLHESGEWIENMVIVPITPMAKRGGGELRINAQAFGSAVTYGRRYGVSALLGLATEDDDDANAIAQTPARDASPRGGRAPQSDDRRPAGGQGQRARSGPQTGTEAAAPARRVVKMPAGPHRGVALDDPAIPLDELKNALAVAETGNATKWAAAFRAEIERRELALDAARTEAPAETSEEGKA